MPAVFVVILCSLITTRSVVAQTVDLDSVAMEAGGRMLDRYLVEHALKPDSVRFSSLSQMRLPIRLQRSSGSKLITIYELHSDLVRMSGGGGDSLHTWLSGLYVPQAGSSAEKIYLESTEPIRSLGDVNLRGYQFVTVRDATPPSFWHSIVEPGLVIVGAAAIVALFFLIRS